MSTADAESPMIQNTFVLLKNNIAIVRDFTLLSGLRVVQLAAGFASTFFVVRAISQEQFGYYQFVLSAAASLSVFALPEMNNAIMQSWTRGFQGTYRKAAKIVLFCCLAASIILIGMSVWFFNKQLSVLGFALLIAAIFFPFSSGLILWKGRCMALGRFGDLVRLDGLNSVVTSLGIIASVTTLPGNYLLPLVIVFLGPALRNVLTTLSDLKAISKDGAVEEGIVKYGVQTSIYSGLTIFAARLDSVVLLFFLTPSAVALFAAANRLADLVRAFTQDVAGALAPRLVKQVRYTKRLDFVFRLYALAMGSALVFFAFAMLPWAFPLIFTHRYDAALPYAQALICSVAIGNLATMRFRYIRSRMDALSYRNVMLVSAAAKLGSLLILVPLFGVAGAVASAFIYRVANLGAVHLVIRKSYAPQ